MRMTATAVSDREIRRLQILTEVLLTVAPGRPVAVPQSWAFDSRASCRWRRRCCGRAGAFPVTPFRRHLFGGTKSYGDAVRITLSQIGHRRRPFLSALLPELHDPAYRNVPPGT